MAVMVGLSGTIACTATGAEIDLAKFWTMVLGYALFALAISGICFAASCWFNKGGESLMVGAGLPIAFFLFEAMSGMSGLEFLKYLSLNTLFDTTAIIAGDGYVIQFIVLGLIAVALYTIGINKFLRKDLPL
jgi:ABC-2 type transport system permease protein